MAMINELLRAITKKRATTKYPYEKSVVVEGLRAQLLCNHQVCIWCGICVRNCPSSALDLVSEMDKQLRWNMGRCLLCGLCEDLCPVDALSFSPDFELVFEHRDAMTVVINQSKEGK